MFYIVSISDQAFFTIITSALEAYRVSHPEDDDDGENHIPIETYGNIWGYQAKTKRNEIVFRAVLADIDTSAVRTPNSVRPQQKAFDIKEEFVDKFMPEIEYLGDFHSHPYDFENDKVNNVLELERKKLFCFSHGDFKHVKYLQEERNYRLGIVATVFEMPKQVARRNRHIDEDGLTCIRFMYDNLTIWLKVYVFMDSKRIKDKDIALTCPSLGFHAGSVEQE